MDGIKSTSKSKEKISIKKIISYVSCGIILPTNKLLTRNKPIKV